MSDRTSCANSSGVTDIVTEVFGDAALTSLTE